MQKNRANEAGGIYQNDRFLTRKREIKPRKARTNPIFGPGSRPFAYFSAGSPLRLHSAYEPSKSLTS